MGMFSTPGWPVMWCRACECSHAVKGHWVCIVDAWLCVYKSVMFEMKNGNLVLESSSELSSTWQMIIIFAMVNGKWRHMKANTISLFNFQFSVSHVDSPSYFYCIPAHANTHVLGNIAWSPFCMCNCHTSCGTCQPWIHHIYTQWYHQVILALVWLTLLLQHTMHQQWKSCI